MQDSGETFQNGTAYRFEKAESEWRLRLAEMDDAQGRPVDIADIDLDEDAEAELAGTAELHDGVVELLAE